MRDPQRLVDDKEQPELRRLLLAAKHDAPLRSADAKQRVKAAVLAHMRIRDDVHQSGVRRIERVARKEIKYARSWVDQVLAFFAMATALVMVALIMRQAYVSYAEQTPPKQLPRSNDFAPPNVPQVPEYEEMVEHRASITVIEESAPLGESESNVAEPEDTTPPRELVLKLKHRAHKFGTPQVAIRSSCGDPNEWSRSVEMDYPTGAYSAGISGTMNVTCNLSAEGSFSGCVAQKPPGFTSADIGRVLMTMNSWTMTQSKADWAPQKRRCKIDVVLDLGKHSK